MADGYEDHKDYMRAGGLLRDALASAISLKQNFCTPAELAEEVLQAIGDAGYVVAKADSESAAGRMADRPGEADATAVMEAVVYLASRSKAMDAQDAVDSATAALDRLTARLSGAETERDEAQQWCVDEAEKHDATKTRLARAERRLSDYEQALRRLANPESVPRSEDAALLQIEVTAIARAALSGSTRPGEPEED